MKIIALAMLAITLTGCSYGQIGTYSPPTNKWSATLKIVDETGNPVDKANVQISYMVQPPPGKGGWGTYGNYGDKIEGATDTNGMFSASHRDSTHSLGFHIEKAGFYKTFLGYEMGLPERYNYEIWNPNRTLVLKRIIQPIPMYAKFITYTMPTNNNPVGLDLMVGDWTAPHGNGKHAHLFFTTQFEKRAENDFDYQLTVSFPNQGDGIQGFGFAQNESELRSPQQAPESGYADQATKSHRRRPGQYSNFIWNDKTNYFFRVQTSLDEKGKVKSALYGKIYGDFNRFCYYLNPTLNDRNVEFDPKQNLLKNLKDMEQVREP